MTHDPLIDLPDGASRHLTAVGQANGFAFALGWAAGLVVVSVIVLLVAGDVDDPSSTSLDVVN